MKYTINIFIVLFSFNLFAASFKLKIEDIVKKVSSDNFRVYENAQRVYQSKENIKFSRANLLPKLNLWNILKIPSAIVDPMSVGDIIQDIAPFLIPSNWFKLKQAKYLYKAQKEQYNALWANEVNTAKLLFMSVYRDEQLLGFLNESVLKYKDILDIAQARSTFGQGNIFAYNLIQGRYLALIEDKRNLANFVYSQKKELQFLTGINNEEEIVFVHPNLPEVANATKISFSKIIFKVIEASPEVYQYEHLLNALKSIKGQISFSVMGTSTYSIGGTGVFDNIPIQNGLGFGMSSSVNIAKSEGRILRNQLKATIETLKRQVNVLVKEYNSLIENVQITQSRFRLAEENYNEMIQYISIGGQIGALEMMEILDNLYNAKILLSTYKFRFNDLEEKLMRMTFSGDYKNGSLKLEGGHSEKL